MAAAAPIATACGSSSSLPEVLREGRGIYADICSTCHGNRGQGGVGPNLSNVLATWPSCDDQQRWITIGSEGWKAEHGPTYGALDAPITAVMPAHGDRLSGHEIAAVAAFERVQYGGADVTAALADCGLPVP